MDIGRLIPSQINRYVPFSNWSVPERVLTIYMGENSDAGPSKAAARVSKVSGVKMWLNSLGCDTSETESDLPESNDQVARIIANAQESFGEGMDWREDLTRYLGGGRSETVSLQFVKGIGDMNGFGVANRDSDEIELARRAGVERGLVSAGYELETGPGPGGTFSFDFRTIVELLSESFKTQIGVSGEQIVNALQGTATSKPRVCIMNTHGVTIFVGPECVGGRFKRRPGKEHGSRQEDTWRGFGSVLTGPLKLAQGGGYMSPTLSIDVAVIRGGMKVLDQMLVTKSPRPLFTRREKALIMTPVEMIAAPLASSEVGSFG